MEVCVVDNKAGILPHDQEKSVLDVFKERINKALENNHKLSFYIATGFFFFEGFKRLYPDLKELSERGLLEEFKIIMGPETKKYTKDVLQALKNDAAELNDEVYNFIKELYDKNKFDFRIYLNEGQLFHIKLYLFERQGVLEEVWAGSANFTEGGLEKNVELIVSTGSNERERNTYKRLFDELWKKSTDEVEKLKVIDIIEEAAKEKYLYLPPRDFFAYVIKLLSKERLLENITIDVDYLGKFQRMSVDLIMDKMEKYGGVILANSVGLGKTDIASAIIKHYTNKGEKALLIIPPVLKKHWKATLEKVEVDDKDINILSRGLLQKPDFDCEKYSGYQLIVVDEAHHFRISKPKSNRRKNLEEITKLNPNAQVLLITATPINTSLADLSSLIRLFERGKYLSVFEEEGLSSIIKEVEKRSVNKKDIDKYVIELIKKLSENFVIRFDWLDIVKYFKEDLIKIAGVDRVEPPDVRRIEFNYKKEIVKNVFDKVVDFLEKLNYEYTKLWEGEYKEDKNLIWWYRWRLYKRLESSLYAFKRSLEKMKKRNEFLIEIFSKRRKSIPKTNLFTKDRLEAIITTYSTLDNNQREKIINNMKKDVKEIEKMLKNLELAKRQAAEDSKLKELLKVIEKEKNKPMIIFSESRDTVIYISKFLKENDIKKFIYVYGGGIEEEGEEFYGETIKEVDKDRIQKEFNKGRYDIIATTDVLAEGVNLPRADVVINFDLPYNPVRLIQRDGRALRLNNPKKIKIYNFIPEKAIDKELDLFKILKTRIELILAAVGLDFVVWSIEKSKLKKFSDKHRERATNLIREWKELLATKTPEELKSRVLSKVSKENKVLKEFAEFFNISLETLEKYNRKFLKPVYTCLKSEKPGYWIVFKRKGKEDVLFTGDIQSLESFRGEARDRITSEDEKAINEIIKKEIDKRIMEKIKSPVEDDKTSREIRKLLDKHIHEVLSHYNPKMFSEKEKRELLSKLREIEKAFFIKQEKLKKEVKKMIMSKSRRGIIDKDVKQDTKKELAVIKYVKV